MTLAELQKRISNIAEDDYLTWCNDRSAGTKCGLELPQAETQKVIDELCKKLKLNFQIVK